MAAYELRVNWLKMKDSRSICGKSGKFYTVSGGVGKLVIFACSRHARKMERIGLHVIPVTPLEASAFKTLREGTIEDEQVNASTCAHKLAEIAEKRRRA